MSHSITRGSKFDSLQLCRIVTCHRSSKQNYPFTLYQLASLLALLISKQFSDYHGTSPYFVSLTLVCGRTSPSTRCDANEIMSILGSVSVQDAEGKASMSVLCTVMKDGMYGRRLAVLEKGPIAAVPMEAQVGDLLLVLIGCSVSFSSAWDIKGYLRSSVMEIQILVYTPLAMIICFS